MAEKKKFVPVVAVLNMKGGVGKTTLSANLFRRLYHDKKKSCTLVDLDPQFNLTQSLFTKSQYEKIKSDNNTIARIFYKDTKSSIVAISDKHDDVPDPSELKHTLRYIIGKEDIKIDIIPGDFNLVRFSLMDEKETLNRAKKRFKLFIEKCREENDLIVLDCNPSSSFLTLCAISVCTHILVPVRLDKYSIIGLEMLWDFVNDILPLNPKPEFTIIINGSRASPTKAMREVEAELRGHAIFGSKTLGNSVRETGQLSARADYTGFSADRKTSVTIRVRKELEQVADELSAKIGLTK